jgi:hypothetical protein
LITALIFLEKRRFFRRTSAKSADNFDPNIDSFHFSFFDSQEQDMESQQLTSHFISPLRVSGTSGLVPVSFISISAESFRQNFILCRFVVKIASKICKKNDYGHIFLDLVPNLKAQSYNKKSNKISFVRKFRPILI